MDDKFNVLDQILSDFKVPRRKLELDPPISINEIKGKQDKVYEEVLNNDYLAFTRNLKIAKTVPLTELEKTKQDELVNKVYNFDYLPNKDSRTDYDILKEGYELLYAVYLEEKRNVNNIFADYTKIASEHHYVKQNIQKTLLEIKQNIETKSGEILKYELEIAIGKIRDTDMDYIQKLRKAIDSNILTDKERINILYDLLEIDKEE
jgi:hypothetical protein